jgi:hypothetical protein
MEPGKEEAADQYGVVNTEVCVYFMCECMSLFSAGTQLMAWLASTTICWSMLANTICQHGCTASNTDSAVDKHRNLFVFDRCCCQRAEEGANNMVIPWGWHDFTSHVNLPKAR